MKPKRSADLQESDPWPSSMDKLTPSKPAFGLAQFGKHGASLLRGFSIEVETLPLTWEVQLEKTKQGLSKIKGQSLFLICQRTSK